jgi:hypothetical protein
MLRKADAYGSMLPVAMSSVQICPWTVDVCGGLALANIIHREAAECWRIPEYACSPAVYSPTAALHALSAPRTRVS